MLVLGNPMFSTYSDLAPIVILLTLVLSLLIGRNIKRDNLRGFDDIFAVLGFLFGLFMTLMNLIYTSKDLFLLSPVIAISCLLYLRYHSEFKENLHTSLLEISIRNNTRLSIIWWFLISAVLVTYHLSEIYTRNPLFFFLLAGAVAVLGVQIISFRGLNETKTIFCVVKILLLSVILRASAYFISPYPVGSDPWEHQEYVSYFLDYARITVPSDFSIYYVNYPIAHLHAVCASLLASISPHDAMFLLGVILTLSTIITFLIVKILTKNVQLALISMLLLNFIDVHIQWSIQVIAMSFGMAIYAFIIFFALSVYSKPKSKTKFVALMLVFLSIIVWIHTISAFVTLVSLFALFIGRILYSIIYEKGYLSFKTQDAQLLTVPLMFLVVIITYHWMDPSYPFFDKTFGGLLNSLSMDAEFLGATTVSNVHGRWVELLQPLGFCLYSFFGVIGALYCLSRKKQAKKYFPLIVLVLVLFFVRYTFPIFGINNIVPARWPVFAFICFALFIGLGVFCALNLLKTKRTILCVIAIFFFAGSLSMVTNGLANNDSPPYGGEVYPKLVWTESEMDMFCWVNTTYSGKIVTDEHTRARPFKIFFKNSNAKTYNLLSDGRIDTLFLSNNLIIWRENSLYRPVTFTVPGGRKFADMLLDENFLKYLDTNCGCIIDVGTAKSYLSKY